MRGGQYVLEMVPPKDREGGRREDGLYEYLPKYKRYRSMDHCAKGLQTGKYKPL